MDDNILHDNTLRHTPTPVGEEGSGRRSARRGRKRSARAHAAILAATAALLDSEGYGAVTMEAIAAQAGASKATLYRWWPSKRELVLEVYGAALTSRVPPVDAGSLRRDLAGYLELLVASLSRPGAASALRGMIGEAQVDGDFAAAFRESVVAAGERVVGRILLRAAGRGELRGGVAMDDAVAAVLGPVWYRLLAGGRIDREFAATHAATVAATFTERDSRTG